MARSLLRQLEQIRRSATYDDDILSVNTSSVAEPTVSGSLEEDTNVIRTLLKQLKGSTNWYDDPGKYFNPLDTTSGNALNKQMSFANIKGNTLDSKTVILAVTEDASGAGLTVSGTSIGVLATITTSYALPTVRTGLPIFESIANAGAYWDESGSDNVCRVDVLDMSNDSEFADPSENIIYAKMYDGADYGGSGTGTDVYFRFWADNAETTLSGTGVTSVKFIFPQRRQMSSMQEYEWMRTDFVSSWEGDIELIEDINNLWSFTGAGNGVIVPVWTNTTANYILGSETDLEAGINSINDEIGNRNYTQNYYITDGDIITDSLEDLDLALKVVDDQIDAGIGDKYVESVVSTITAGVQHPVPVAFAYTPDSTAGQEGSNMNVFVDGQLLAADTGTNGANADRDYGETSTSGVTFRFSIQVGRNITYVVKQ